MNSPRPKALSVLWENIPRELVLLPQWLCWRFEQSKNKWTKVPRRVGGKNADATDPTTWADFTSVRKAIEAGTIDFDGVGIVFTGADEYAGIDLDGCIDAAGTIAPEAMAIINKLNSYTEISPSGTGVKIWVKGRLPDKCRHSTTEVTGFKKFEVYDRGRYFTVTGHHLHGTPKTIEARQAELDAVYVDVFVATAPATSTFAQAIAEARNGPEGYEGGDGDLLAAARESRSGEKFIALFDRGDLAGYGEDHSLADLALCGMLAFWAGPDKARIERLFSMSKLGQREKWTGREDYRERTIARALEGRTEFYRGNGHAKPAQAGEGGAPAAIDLPIPAGSEPEPEVDAESDGAVKLGDRDPESGRLVLSPSRTLPTAAAFIREFHLHPEGRTLRTYADIPMEWRENRYVEMEAGTIRQKLHPWLHAALRYTKPVGDAPPKLIPFDSNPRTVNAALDTIKAHTHVPAGLKPPCWLGEGTGRPSALELLPCRTMTLHVPTGGIIQPTPLLFTTNAIAFDYDPNPPPPIAWLDFLAQLWGDDAQSVQLLQEFMGYCLIADTSQQKMLMLVGPRRSGKGTIGRVLTSLVGADNVVGPTCSSLAGSFGLQVLIGKTVALVSDARFHGESVPILVERLLCISGEDAISIDRKFLSPVTMKLLTRFVFLTNELPHFRDSSAALAGRFVILRLTRSFYGSEDHGLTSRLQSELPGILHWSLEGLRRLRARGRFLVPKSSEEAVQELEDLASPIGAFVRECCVVAPGQRVDVDELFAAWKNWCDAQGRDFHGEKQRFGRDLNAAVPGVKRRRGSYQSFYEGIGLRQEIPQ